MTVLEAINYRTRYRGNYESAEIPRDDLIKIMQAGLAAPFGCNKQTTSLIAVDAPELLSELREIITGLRRPTKAETAPAIICVLTQKICAVQDRYVNVQDYAAAIENMLLAIVSLGYQSCWIEGDITDTDALGRKMTDILGVPIDYELVCILPVGVAMESIKNVNKKSFEERTWFNGFKKVV